MELSCKPAAYSYGEGAPCEEESIGSFFRQAEIPAGTGRRLAADALDMPNAPLSGWLSGKVGFAHWVFPRGLGNVVLLIGIFQVAGESLFCKTSFPQCWVNGWERTKSLQGRQNGSFVPAGLWPSGAS
jgi:hypothetical protein